MVDRTLEQIMARTRKRHGASRSDAYRWLHQRHRQLMATFTAFPPVWTDVAATMAAKGITGGRGRPLTGEAVRRIWERVCRDLEAAAALQRTGVRPGKANRTSTAAGWHPIPIPAQAATPIPSSPDPPVAQPGLLTRIGRSLGGSSSRQAEDAAEALQAADPAPPALPREGGPLTPEQVRAMKADLQRTLDERSGR